VMFFFFWENQLFLWFSFPNALVYLLGIVF